MAGVANVRHCIAIAVSGHICEIQGIPHGNLTIKIVLARLRGGTDPDGTVGQLINNDSMYNSVDSLLSDIDELVRKIQENPKKYIKISVF